MGQESNLSEKDCLAVLYRKFIKMANSTGQNKSKYNAIHPFDPEQVPSGND